MSLALASTAGSRRIRPRAPVSSCGVCLLGRRRGPAPVEQSGEFHAASDRHVRHSRECHQSRDHRFLQPEPGVPGSRRARTPCRYSCGTLGSGQIGARGQVDLFTFSGPPGQIVSLALASTGGFSTNPAASTSVELTVFAPRARPWPAPVEQSGEFHAASKPAPTSFV